MKKHQLLKLFSENAVAAGGEIIAVASMAEAAECVASRVRGPVLAPAFATAGRFGLQATLKDAGVNVVSHDFRKAGDAAEAGLTGVNFAIADTGTLVLESTPEDIRLATTLPPKHFALLDPRKIVADGPAAVPYLRRLHERDARNYIAYITGPSRTADIERVLTIGVHGPKELLVLLVPGLSDDYLEM